MAHAAAHAVCGDDSICRAFYDTRAWICAFNLLVVMTKQLKALSMRLLCESSTGEGKDVRQACRAGCAAVRQIKYDHSLELILSLLSLQS
jgi:hypothetical protein